MKPFFLRNALVALSLASWAFGAEFHVAPGGDDSGPGTASRPFATLERARDAARAVDRTREKTIVWIADGRYVLARAFELSSLDGGGPAMPVEYRGEHRQAAVLTTSVSLPLADFAPVTGTPMEARLRPEARGHVRSINLKARGIRNIARLPDAYEAGSESLIQLFADGVRLPLSRYPNEGSMTMAKVIDKGRGVFAYRDPRHAAWTRAVRDGLWLLGFWRVPWQPYGVRVASIDTAARSVTLAAGVPGGIGDKYSGPEGSGQEPYVALNLPEEIDRPGEWYLDFATGLLYLWIPDGAREIRVAENGEPLVRMQGAANLVLRDLAFQDHLGDGIDVNGGQDVLIAGCRFSDVMGYGIRIEGGSRVGAQSCDLERLGGGGIFLAGGNRRTLTPAGHYAVNNDIRDFGLVKTTFAGGVEIAGSNSNSIGAADAVGMRVAHNRIHGSPHVGIFYGGNDNIFEYNEIYDVVKVSQDMGAFYTWGDWTSRGNLIRYNYVHDSPQANAFYADDGDSGDRFFGNVVRDLRSGAYFGGGHDNVAANNLFLRTPVPAHVDARGLERGYDLGNARMVDRVRSVPFLSAPWSLRYPEMTHMLNAGFPLALPTGSRVECNLASGATRFADFSAQDAAQWGVTLGTNRVSATAIPAGADLKAVGASGIQRELGCFQPIPLDSIGLQVDAYRPALPNDGGSPIRRTSQRLASPNLSAIADADGSIRIRLDGIRGAVAFELRDVSGRTVSAGSLAAPPALAASPGAGAWERRLGPFPARRGVWILQARAPGVTLRAKVAP